MINIHNNSGAVNGKMFPGIRDKMIRGEDKVVKKRKPKAKPKTKAKTKKVKRKYVKLHK